MRVDNAVVILQLVSVGMRNNLERLVNPVDVKPSWYEMASDSEVQSA